MPRKLKDADGLTPNEARFAFYLCEGQSQKDAFKKAWPKSRATAASIHERASHLANSPAIKARCREILSQKKLSDLDNAPQAFKDLLSALQAATDARNWTAVAALSRLRLDCLGLLKSSHAGMADHGLSDEILLDKLAGSNPELRKQLKGLLGSDNFETPDPVPTVPGSTKH
jgi:hypothetical protein